MRRHLWWLVGLALVCGGLAVVLASRGGPDDFGWFAYTPSSRDADWSMGWGDPRGGGSALVVTRWQLAGAALAALGLVIVAAGAGFRLGRRRPPT